MGIILAFIFLFLFDRFGGNIMPEVFVERKIPIYITPKGIFISFFIPYIISVLFSFLSLKQFKKDQSLLDNVRAVG
jgi:lipoprotein-releasing system permease protein